jgi:hypothetical protein
MTMLWNRSRCPLGHDYAHRWLEDVDAPPSGPRVLFESADAAEAHAVWKLLTRHGYQTMWCPGPQGGVGAKCQLAETGRCGLVDEADAVICALDLNDSRCAKVASTLDTQAAQDTPIVVMAPLQSAEKWSDELRSSRVVVGPLRSGLLLRSLRSVAAPAQGRG